MKLTTISATYERKLNLDECAAALWTMATENVRYKANQIRKGNEPDPEPIYLGLPIRFDDPSPALNGHLAVETNSTQTETEES